MRNFRGGELRNIRGGVEKFSGGELRNFRGGGVEKYSGEMVESGGVKFFR